MKSDPVFVLASGSPRRKELIKLLELSYRTSPTNLNEVQHPGERPVDTVQRLAEEKARSAAEQAATGSFVLAADTIVVDQGQILDKPADEKEALETLQRLRGRRHQVYTAIAVLETTTGKLFTDLCLTEVPMRSYNDQELQEYVATGDPYDKAGAYAIQHPGFRPVESLDGCYANVVGLPLCHLTRTLSRFGYHLGVDVPEVCQRHLKYDCPIYQEVLDFQSQP